MKKALLVIGLVVVVGGALYVRARYKEGARLAEPDVVRNLSGDEVMEGIRSEDPKTRMDALSQIEKLPEDVRRTALLDALLVPYAPTRLAALSALVDGFGTDPEVVDRLLETARSDLDNDVRDRAFRALEVSADPRVLLLAARVLESADEPLIVRLSAARSLDRLTGRESAKELAGLLDGAEVAADDLAMDWDEWLSDREGRLTWDPDEKRFVE